MDINKKALRVRINTMKKEALEDGSMEEDAQRELDGLRHLGRKGVI